MKGKGTRAEVVMCSREASKRHISAGMKLSEAQAVCSDLQWREHNPQLYITAQKQLSRELIACTPKVTVEEPGSFLLDASGLQHLGGEEKFCRQVQKLANSCGFSDVQIGIADTAFSAMVASRCKNKSFYLVPAGRDAAFLAPLSIKHLPLEEDIQESMFDLGLRTMGQMISLSRDALIERFGRQGALAYDLASGIDPRYPTLPELEKEFKCFVEIGGPIELLNETQFVLKSMLDRLTSQLKQEGFWAEELLISFFNDNDKFDERPVKLLRPSNHPKFLLEVLKLSLESHPLMREFTAVELAISRFSKEGWEQTNIQAPDLDDDQDGQEEEGAAESAVRNYGLALTLMLQRFITRLGDDAVVRSVPNDQYVPERAGAWMPVTGSPPVTSVLPVNVNYVNAHATPAGLVCGLVLKKAVSPSPVLVELDGEIPKAITYEGRWHKIREITEPEKLSGLWWENPVRKTYYVALIEPFESRGALAVATTYLVLLVYDHLHNQWLVEGFFD